MVIEDFVRDWLDGLEKKYDVTMLDLTEESREKYVLEIVNILGKSVAEILLQAECNFLKKGTIKPRKGNN